MISTIQYQKIHGCNINIDYSENEVTNNFRVDQYDNVYDENEMFYCKWNLLTATEKRLVKQNDFSAR